MEDHGVRVDVNLMQEVRAKIVEDLKSYGEKVTAALLQEPKIRGWIIERAYEAYPPKNKGTFAQRLLEQTGTNLIKSEKTGKYTLNKSSLTAMEESPVKHYLLTGDESHLTKEQIVRCSLSLWKEDNGGEFFNIQSKDQLGKIAFDVLGLKPLSATTKGKAQFDEDMIQSISDQFEWAKYLRIYNKLTKTKSAYIDRFLDSSEDGKFYPYFKQNGTVSGRYGSDLQQLPKPLEPGRRRDHYGIY